MYIVDFFKNLFKKNNIGIIIWMILNISLICFIFVAVSEAYLAEDIALSILTALGVYLVSIIIALSPIGEAILRWQNGCHKVSDPNILARIQPLFDDVYARAKSKNPELPDNIKLYMSDDETPNAFATGRHTVCFTEGLLVLSDSDIKGILAHEFGHLAHKDTDTLLVMTTGNLIVSAIFTIWRFIFNAFAVIFRFVVGIASNSVGAVIASAITRIFIDFILVAIMNLWTKLGVLICLTSSRANEFLADQYAHELGLGRELANALTVLDGAAKPKGLWATLNSSHPATPDRVNKLNGLLSLAY